MSQIRPYAECHYAECRYADCLYAECRGAPEKLTHSGGLISKPSLCSIYVIIFLSNSWAYKIKLFKAVFNTLAQYSKSHF